jgi:hypothetical protein
VIDPLRVSRAGRNCIARDEHAQSSELRSPDRIASKGQSGLISTQTSTVAGHDVRGLWLLASAWLARTGAAIARSPRTARTSPRIRNKIQCLLVACGTSSRIDSSFAFVAAMAASHGVQDSIGFRYLPAARVRIATINCAGV